MDIGTIDHWANNRTSSVHRASAPVKLLAAGLIIAAVIASDDLVVLLSIYLALVALIVATKLPVPRILALGAYPAIFAILFAISRWNGSPVGPAVVLLKAMDAALAMLMVITTTPYPAVFAVFARILPGRLADALFLTYRAVFLLLAVLGVLLTALRLRGGLRSGHYRQATANLAMSLGLLLLRAIDLSEDLYGVMRLRGYRGRLAAAEVWRPLVWDDLLPLAFAGPLLGLALALRLRPGTLLEYNGYILAISLLVLLVAVALTRWPSWVPTGGNGWRR